MKVYTEEYTTQVLNEVHSRLIDWLYDCFMAHQHKWPYSAINSLTVNR